jgi:energy-converting hydrogenase Eha subunit E
MIVGAVLIVLGSVLLTFMPSTLPDGVYSWIIAIATVGQGINFLTYSIGLLAVTPVQDMAVAMSTLFLFRNLGNVLGVAISSLVSQNALVHYLLLMVVGSDAAEVINKARESVETIGQLSLLHREQGPYYFLSIRSPFFLVKNFVCSLYE